MVRDCHQLVYNALHLSAIGVDPYIMSQFLPIKDTYRSPIVGFSISLFDIPFCRTLGTGVLVISLGKFIGLNKMFCHTIAHMITQNDYYLVFYFGII